MRRSVSLIFSVLSLIVLVSPGFPQFTGEERLLEPEGIERPESDLDVPRELLSTWFEVRVECVVFRGPREIVLGPCTYQWSCARRGYSFGQDVYEYLWVETCCQAWLYLYGIRLSPLGDPVCERNRNLENVRVVCGCVPNEPVPFHGQEEEG